MAEINKYPLKSSHKARVRDICGGCAIFRGCGRWIEPGEIYYQTYRCGLNSYKACKECAEKQLNPDGEVHGTKA